MNNTFKFGIVSFIALLIAVNAYIFVNGIQLSNEISSYERDIKTLYTANMELENKVYSLDSLRFAASVAAQLEFSEGKEPIYLNGLNYARR